jgi:hypothetical protein
MAESDCVKYWEIIADNLSKAGWSWGCVSAIDSRGRTIWIADAHLDDGKRFVVRAEEKLTAFVELESAIRAARCRPNAYSLTREFTAPVGWVGIEDCLRKCPRMSPWVEERALAFAIHVIRGFSDYTSTGCLGT